MIFEKIKNAFYDYFEHLIKGSQISSEVNVTLKHEDELIESVIIALIISILLF